jgi:hypothetical protein
LEKIPFSDVVGIGGIALATVLLVLDKAGKLKGGWLLGLLCIAGAMTLFIALGNSWVMDSPYKWRLWRGALMVCFVAFTYSGLAIWIAGAESETEGPKSSAEPSKQLPQVTGKVPGGMTLTPRPGNIQLTFQSSPLFNHKVRQRITGDLTRFRDYLVGLGIPVPVDLPPVGTHGDAGTGTYTPMGLPPYRGRLVFGEKAVMNRMEATGLYCGHVMNMFLFGSDSPLKSAFGEVPITKPTIMNLGAAQMTGHWLCTYLNYSFWNTVEKNRPFELQGFLAGALWDIREKFDHEFADQMIGYTMRAMMDEPMKTIDEDINEYFIGKMKIGESVVDNDGSRWPEIDAIVRKHGLFSPPKPYPVPSP